MLIWKTSREWCVEFSLSRPDHHRHSACRVALTTRCGVSSARSWFKPL